MGFLKVLSRSDDALDVYRNTKGLSLKYRFPRSIDIGLV
jgi:hypothetical protein